MNTVAGWAWTAGFRTLGILTTVCQCAGGTGKTENDKGGIWGLGGTPGDGPGQAKIAYETWKRSEWREFPGYQTARYYLVAPQAAIAAVFVNEREGVEETASDVADAVTDVTDTVSDVAVTAKTAFAVLSRADTWRVVAKVTLGGALIIVAAVMLAKGSNADTAAGSVSSATKKVARAVVTKRVPKGK